MPNRDARAIRAYYEQNTRLFLRFAPSAGLTIHRALWADAVTTHERALNYSNELILAEILRLICDQALDPIRLLDLGCGVGASLFYLLPRLPTPGFGVGVTISELQARLAREQARRLSLNHCHLTQADFQALPLPGKFDIVYSIEAFVHAAMPENFFAEVARLLEPAGRLILIDDFLSDFAARSASDNERRWVDAYQSGWHVPNLRTVSENVSIAHEKNLRLIDSRDLTPMLRLRALPDVAARIVHAIGERIPARHPIVPSMLGSLALQQCLKMGIVEYRMLVFEK